MTDKIAINVSNLQFGYQGPINNKVIDIENWQLEQGESVFLSGPSGSGKSTLINLLCGALSPNSGEITLLSRPFSQLSSRQRDKFRAQHIGVVFQQFNLIPYLSIRQNILAAAHFAGTEQDLAKQRMQQYFERLELPLSLLNQTANTLSVGQQQRVAIARALINEPEILVVDEPTSALDSNARDGFIRLLLECLNYTNSSLVFVSHDMALAPHFSQHVKLADINQVGAAI